MPSTSPAEAYRLWQLWQQMRYPTPLPAVSDIGVDLVALDGKAGTALDRYFGQARRRVLDDDCRAALDECLAELDLALASVQGDPARYFQQLRRLAVVRGTLDEALQRVDAMGGESAASTISA